jgi:hypothetical protein
MLNLGALTRFVQARPAQTPDPDVERDTVPAYFKSSRNGGVMADPVLDVVTGATYDRSEVRPGDRVVANHALRQAFQRRCDSLAKAAKAGVAPSLEALQAARWDVVCPITLDPPRRPVQVASIIDKQGVPEDHVFEAADAHTWIAAHGTSPVTNQAYRPPLVAVPNLAVQALWYDPSGEHLPPAWERALLRYAAHNLSRLRVPPAHGVDADPSLVIMTLLMGPATLGVFIGIAGVGAFNRDLNGLLLGGTLGGVVGMAVGGTLLALRLAGDRSDPGERVPLMATDHRPTHRRMAAFA